MTIQEKLGLVVWSMVHFISGPPEEQWALLSEAEKRVWTTAAEAVIAENERDRE